MGLKEQGIQIDAALADDYQRWKRQIIDFEKVIEEQETILRSDEAQGDKSENAVYQAATDLKQKTKLEIQQWSEKIASFENSLEKYSTKLYKPEGIIKIGTVIRLKHLKTDTQHIVKIVPKRSDSPRKGAISPTSILGSALLNKHEGETVECITERGLQQFLIVEVY